jgi:Lhr-like helicase
MEAIEMVKAIWVEDMDKVERTNALREDLEKYGFKLTLDEFANLLEGKLSIKKTNDIVNTLKEQKVAVLGAAYNAPTMIGYGIMKLKNENGFYISYMKVKPSGSPEVRLIIENEQEFRSWLRCFVQDIKHQ